MIDTPWQRLNPLHSRLAFKLAACVVVSTGAFFALFGFFNLRMQQAQSEQLLLRSADRVSDIIERSTRYQMMRNDRTALYEIMKAFGSEPGIRRVRILNKEGRISFSTDASEVNRVVDKSAEACYGCHAQEAPLTRLARPDRSRIFTETSGERLLGMIRPIENRPACSDAACHAHPPTQRILGVIDANLSLAEVDAQIVQHRRRLAGFTLLAMILASMGSALFTWIVLHRPVRELKAGTQRVAGGDLAYRLPVRSQDELGDLAAAFNKMTEELAAAQAEINEWTCSLERRVEQKSRELEQAHTSLVGSEKMASIGKLAATVAHEVNNPLFGILTYARLTLRALEKSDLREPVRAELVENLRIIERESRRCGDIMRNLLTFARQAPSQREPQDLNTLVERALTLVRHKFDLQGIELGQQLSPQLPPVPSDAGQIQQAVLIILVNAGDAMPRGGALRIATGYDAGAGMAEIRIADTGGGIPPEVLPHIFDPFFTTKEDEHRTGLGLAVARSIVEQHGGSIAARSKEGEGTEFTIRLPLELSLAAGVS
ncbi:MAG: HAMP domain-containing protein [Bryobacterales bacterium]|nr:HAMP domain-containing protein [Bryobacterales bacterium]